MFVFAFWLAVIIAYVSAILPSAEAPHIAAWDKLNHMLAFFTITFLARAAYPKLAVLPLFALLAAFGAFIELSQAVPFIHRDAEWDDWFADVFAIVVGLVLAWPIAWLAKRHREASELAPDQRAQTPEL